MKKEDPPHRSSPKKPVPSPRQSPIAAVTEVSSVYTKEKIAHEADISTNDNNVMHHHQENQIDAGEMKNSTSYESPHITSVSYSQSSDKQSCDSLYTHSYEKNLLLRKVASPHTSPIFPPKASTPVTVRKVDSNKSASPAHHKSPNFSQEVKPKHMLNSPMLSQRNTTKTEVSCNEEECVISQSPVIAIEAPTDNSNSVKDLRQLALSRHLLQSSSMSTNLPLEEIENEQLLVKPETKRRAPEAGIPDGEVLSGAWTELCGLLVRLEACSPGAVRGGPHSTEFDTVDAGGGLGRMALEARRLVTESKMLIRAATFAIGGGRALSPLGKHAWPGTTSPLSSPTSSRAPQGSAAQIEVQELQSSLDLHLNQCLLLLNRLTQLCEASSSGPGWQVARKVADVTVAFGEAVRVIAGWVGGSGETGDTSAIECAAEGLASALASLLRSLRVVPR